MPQLKAVAIVGAGPAGLIAAERLADSGYDVTVYDRMRSPARKFLRAGLGGLNLTNALPPDAFVQRYTRGRDFLAPALSEFPAAALIAWANGLGIETFTGSSGRVFPKAMKASPLLRAWQKRLEANGVRFVSGARWLGWTDTNALHFATAENPNLTVTPAATLLALGGASWPQLGSDGAWTDLLRARGVRVEPLRPSNCGFLCDWSERFADRFAGAPLKPVIAHFADHAIQGEITITRTGIEGGPVYAHSGALRDSLDAGHQTILKLNLRPIPREALIAALHHPQGSQSLSNHLRRAANLSPVAIGLIQEALHKGHPRPATPDAWADLIQAFPLPLTATAPIARAISSAGGIALDEIAPDYRIAKLDNVFAAGEMLDWDAPTGGFLLQACFATGIAAAKGIKAQLDAAHK